MTKSPQGDRAAAKPATDPLLTSMADPPSGSHSGPAVGSRTDPAAHTVTDQVALKLVRDRLRRAQGQIGGVLSMMEQGRSCKEVVTQLAAVNKAIDKAAFVLIATGLRECLDEDDGDTEAVVEQLQKLFLTMA